MIFVHFEVKKHKKHGILEGKTIYELNHTYFGSCKKTGKKYELSKVKLLAPCNPSKIVAMGLNYLEHARELKMPIPLHPLIFMKAPSSLLNPGGKIVCPPSSKRVDYEAELAIVIKKKTKNVSPKKAFSHILGFTCLNDVTARDLQSIDGQWARSKSFDTFCPVGPWIVSGIDPNNLKIETRLNGRCVQKSNTNDLIFKVGEIVSFVSQIMTLMPGDVIATGTPPGVGQIKPGDTVKIKIEHIGELVNKVGK